LVLKCAKLKRILAGFDLHHQKLFSSLPAWIVEPVLRAYYRNVWDGLPADPKVLFIHIPKTGGTSVTKVLYGRGSGHPPCYLYKAADNKRFHSVEKFAIIRNPYDRFCSIFHHYSFSPRASSWDKLQRDCFFSLFKSPKYLAHALERNKKVKATFLSYILARPQVEWIMSESVILVDHLFPFENMYIVEDYLRKILRHPKVKLPHLNSSKRTASWKSELDNRSKRIIGKIYRKDIEMWERIWRAI
jgi:hypothetical protein